MPNKIVYMQNYNGIIFFFIIINKLHAISK